MAEHTPRPSTVIVMSMELARFGAPHATAEVLLWRVAFPRPMLQKALVLQSVASMLCMMLLSGIAKLHHVSPAPPMVTSVSQGHAVG
jgi:hypothetical protein